MTTFSPEMVRARRAIESLRSGVPSRQAVRQLGTTQHNVEARFESQLEALEARRPVQPLVIAASFGSGKTHLLEYLQHLAESRGFVTSYAVVSPEMPLGSAHVVLRTIAEAAIAPGRVGKALRALASDLQPSSAAYAEVIEWADEAGLEGRFPAMLELYRELWVDEDLRVQILDDFQGKPLVKTVIKQKLKEIGKATHFDLGRSRNALLAHDRVRLLARLFRAAGCHGWVVLFDELERMARFSYKARLAAYEEIGWWQELAHEAGAALLPVFTMTAGFLQETVTGGSNDVTRMNLPALRSSFEEKDRRVCGGIDALKAHLELDTTTAQQDMDIKDRIRQIYERAYGRTLSPVTFDRSDDLLPIRSKIRKWLTRWDLGRYYEGYSADLQVGAVEFDDTDIADEDLETGGEDEGGGEA